MVLENSPYTKRVILQWRGQCLAGDRVAVLVLVLKNIQARSSEDGWVNILPTRLVLHVVDTAGNRVLLLKNWFPLIMWINMRNQVIRQE